MDTNTQTLVVGLAGLVATLISSGLGLYFTAKTRSAPLRESLYSKQIDLVSEIMLAVGRTRLYAVIAVDTDPANPHRERAREDLSTMVAELSRLSDSAAALLPTELFGEVKQFTEAVTDLSVGLDEGSNAQTAPEQLAGRATKIGLLARTYLGVDELSRESAGLFVTRKDIERLAAISPEAFLEVSRKARGEGGENTSGVKRSPHGGRAEA